MSLLMLGLFLSTILALTAVAISAGEAMDSATFDSRKEFSQRERSLRHTNL